MYSLQINWDSTHTQKEKNTDVVVLWYDLQLHWQQWLTMLICAALFPPKDYDVFSSRYITDEKLGQLIIPCHLTPLHRKGNIRNMR
jgi:hypothetical protein